MLHALATLAAALQFGGTAPPSTELRRQDLMAALRSGGYTILVRHARTLKSADVKETPAYTPAARAEQRNLSEDGVRDVALMGQVFRKYAIPVGEVLSSPLYRTQETAAVFGTPKLTMVLRTFPTTAETAALVAAAPAPGTNRVLVTHHFVIEQHVPGINPGDIAESEAAVVRPAGDGKVILVGRISLSDWEALADVPVSAHPVWAAYPAQTLPALPETRAGRLTARYIEAYNSGSTDRMRAFIETSMVANPDRPMEARLESFTRLFGEQGPLTLISVASSEADSVVFEARSRKSSITVKAVTAPAPADRLQSVTFTMRTPSHP